MKVVEASMVIKNTADIRNIRDTITKEPKLDSRPMEVEGMMATLVDIQEDNIKNDRHK